MKIMISGGQQLAALKIKNKLASSFEVILADYGEVASTGSSFNLIFPLGQYNENTLAHELLKACIDQQVDMFIPLYTKEWEVLERTRTLFSEFQIELAFPDKQHLNKLESSSQFQDFNLYSKGACLFSELDNNLLNFPFSIADFSGLIANNSGSHVANLTYVSI